MTKKTTGKKLKIGSENGREVIRKGNMISDTTRSQVRTKSADVADDGENERKMQRGGTVTIFTVPVPTFEKL